MRSYPASTLHEIAHITLPNPFRLENLTAEGYSPLACLTYRLERF